MSEASPSSAENRFATSAWLFLRLLALVHLVAFVSFWVQLPGLVGPHGLLPATPYFAAIREHYGTAAYAQLPTLCWFLGSDTFLHVLCGAGVALSLLLFAGIAPAVCLALLWAAYLSLNYAGQIFFNFQWDTLLLETTLLGLFLAPWKWLPLWRPQEPPRFARLLLWWLLFRLMFLAGVVKLASGDATWRDLSALTFHYETQPLPTSLGWFAHQLPAWWHRASCAGMFVIELVVPFFLFAPRAIRHNAAMLLITLMVAVALTGNYTFFNFLAVGLCLLCLDDAFLARVTHFLARRTVRPDINTATSASGAAASPERFQTIVATAFAACAFVFTFAQAIPAVVSFPGELPGYRAIAAAIGPFRSLNNYGLFAVMTNPRPELVFEGSNDGRTWEAYELPHKPGALERRPTWVAPHQPRLDWQLWFAALGPPQQNRWVLSVCEHLLRGTPEVLALFRHNPFPGAPPRHIRVVRYEYHFTDAPTRTATGHWWRRSPLDFYVQPWSLK
ncbi:MAG: lipase maturation factor family protein [Verrucomicrobiota bacterium]